MHSSSFDFDVVSGPSTPPRPKQESSPAETAKPPASADTAPPAPPRD
ncbi:MAG TPA: hypothetical protein VIG49_08445 [Acetobacteraceae bacterium]